MKKSENPQAKNNKGDNAKPNPKPVNKPPKDWTPPPRKKESRGLNQKLP